MTSVFTTLIFGVFCNGITMKISDNRGAGQFILALSFNRWAFEVMTLREYSNYMSSQRTTMVVEFAYTGLCGIDLYDESSLSTLLLTFDIDEQCKKHINTAFGVLLAIGFGLRLVSWIIIKIKSLRAYPKIIRVTIKVAVTAASRVSSRAASIFSGRSHAKKSVEEDEGKEHLRGPSRLMGASNRIVPTQNGPSEAEVEAGSSKDKPTHEVEVEAGSTRDHQVKSEATLEKGVESGLTENLT